MKQMHAFFSNSCIPSRCVYSTSFMLCVYTKKIACIFVKEETREERKYSYICFLFKTRKRAHRKHIYYCKNKKTLF